ncbi:MAG: TolC family outer membrane protein [Campylobacterota bacterium]|nr:TolC family outer membrane protein [Campylobacterota bacterium]
MKKRILLALTLITSLNAQDLKTTINEVLSTNPIVLERLKNYNSTKEDITIAQSGYYPSIDLSLGGGFENSKITTPQEGLPNEIDNTGLAVYQNSLTYTQNIFNGFETTHQVQEEEHRTTSAAYSYIEKANDTAFEMLNSYLQVMRNNELLNTAKENIEINEEILKKVQKLYDSGLTTLSEVNKIESSLSLAKSNYVVQENTLLDVKYGMHRILGRYLKPEDMSRPDIQIELPKTKENATQIAMKNNPSLLVGNYNIKLAQATYKGRKSPFYPQIDVEISQSLNRNLSGVEGESDKFRAMAYVKYNLFNGFSDQAVLQKSISTIHKEVEVKNVLRREVVEGLNLSWAAYEKLTQQLVYLKDYKKFSLETLTLYSKEYDLGRRSLLDLLSAQNDFIRSKSQIIDTEYSLLFAKYRILDAMGNLISTIVDGDNNDELYSNVGLRDNTPQNRDSLPIKYDKDMDLIVDEQDICNNSLTTQMRNIYGCEKIYEDTLVIERYSSFLFEDDSAELSDEGEQRLNDLITQLQPYGWDFLKFDILSNAQNDDLNDDELLLLSSKRAEVIKTQLLEAGADSIRVIIHSNADKAPLYSDENADSVELNNRADIIVRKLRKLKY